MIDPPKIPPHSRPQIAIIMPTYSPFSPVGATSIDLCVKELVEHSEFAKDITIVRTAGTEPFEGFNVVDIPQTRFGHRYKAFQLLWALKKLQPDVIVIQQHLPTAHILSVLSGKPVIFHGHNYLKVGKTRISRWKRQRAFSRLSGVVLVSEACKADFLSNYCFRRPVVAVQNGLNMDDWTSPEAKENLVAVIGRCSPEKGIHEAADAILSTLPKHPDWSAEFILSETRTHRTYFEQLLEKIRDQPQISIRTEQPHDVVRNTYRRAAIAMVLSNVTEGFGRTALEALASGCALVTTGMGGLREACGDNALYTDPNDPISPTKLLDHLIFDSKTRTFLSQEGRRWVSTHFEIRNLSAEFFSFILERKRPE